MNGSFPVSFTGIEAGRRSTENRVNSIPRVRDTSLRHHSRNSPYLLSLSADKCIGKNKFISKTQSGLSFLFHVVYTCLPRGQAAQRVFMTDNNTNAVIPGRPLPFSVVRLNSATFSEPPWKKCYSSIRRSDIHVIIVKIISRTIDSEDYRKVNM
ncbi:hypothetical protein CEXT_576161 [Caerostris extrusa]|uniref:Uncharacterized protein n=1 Tax=Caerostris extrusa TaxID=172846 RepID=A0AAV4QEW4_CAEEX|nr:hypothetical protein CEXT_576161 [Caerostris extrusa]